MRFNSRSLAIVATLCGALIACDSDSGTGPDDGSGELSGSVKFTYAGPGHNGAYDATGKFVIQNSMPTVTTFSFGYYSSRYDAEGIGIYSMTVDESKKLAYSFTAMLSEYTVGTYSLNEDCTPTKGTVRCAYADTELDVPMQGDDDDAAIFVLTSGEIKVTSTDGKRIKGTFSATGEDFWAGDETKITITNGTFDVPVIEGKIPGLKSMIPGSVVPGGTRLH